MDTVQVDLNICFNCGDYRKPFMTGTQPTFCGKCGGPLSRKIFDVEAPKPLKAK